MSYGSSRRSGGTLFSVTCFRVTRKNETVSKLETSVVDSAKIENDSIDSQRLHKSEVKPS